MTTATVAVTEPGVYEMDDEAYHRDPVPGGSLSASGVKLLLPKSCPAKFRYAQDHPRPPKREFDLGHAVHRLVLGVGAELVPIDYETYRGLNARELRDGAYAKGLVPLLRHEYELAQEVAKAVLSDPLAGALFSRGKPEQSLFWVDDETGVWRRSRLDWLPDANSWNGRVVIPDLKTADHADPESFGRALHNYGYASQAAFYVDGVLALGLAEDAAFVFVVVEKEPPYLVSFYEPDAEALRIGRERNRRALAIYRDCREAGMWPGYTTDVEQISLPRWVERQHEESE